GGARYRVIDRHRFSRDRRERDGQIGWRNGLGAIRAGQTERDAGRTVVVLDRVTVNGDRAQRRVGRTCKRYFDGFIIFIRGIVYHGDTDVLTGHSRGEGQRAVRQGVIDTPARGGVTRHRVADGHRLA